MEPSPSLRLARGPQTLGIVLPMVAVALATSAGYYVTNPPPLTLRDSPVTATVPSGQPVYLGVYALDEDGGRTLDVRGVQVDVTSTREIAVQPLVCVGGDVDVTTAPDTSCTDIVDPAGVELGPGDDLMLQVTGSGATVALIEPVTLSFVEGVRRGTHQAGAPVRVRVLPAGAPG